jgi:hypothetical protein
MLSPSHKRAAYSCSRYFEDVRLSSKKKNRKKPLGVSIWTVDVRSIYETGGKVPIPVQNQRRFYRAISEHLQVS